MPQQPPYDTLDNALDALRETLIDMQRTLQEVRAAITNEPVECKVEELRKILGMPESIHPMVLANQMLMEHGLMRKDIETLEQWGIMDDTTHAEVKQMVADYIEYRNQE